MIARSIFGILISIVIIEIVLRAGFDLPSIAPYQFQAKSGVISFKPEISTTVSTRQVFSFRENTIPNMLPLVFEMASDRMTSRVEMGKDLNFESYHLLLGDSIALGWPVAYVESPLYSLSHSLGSPVFNCSFLASGPVQIEKMLNNDFCLRAQKLQSAVVQITVHDQFAFPDSLFIDSAGEFFQPLLIYLIHGNPGEMGAVELSDPDLIDKAVAFNDHYFNTFLPLIDKLYTTKIVYLLWRKGSREAFSTISRWVNSTTSNDQRHQKTLTAIMNIEKKLGFKPKIFISRTKESMQSLNERPEVILLTSELRKNDFFVYDMINHKKSPEMPQKFYYLNDLHPNAEGYRLISEELLKLFK